MCPVVLCVGWCVVCVVCGVFVVWFVVVRMWRSLCCRVFVVGALFVRFCVSLFGW